MKIQEQELFHGAVIAQIVEYKDQVKLHKLKGENGCYLINDDITLMVKYRSHRKPPWRFTLTENEEVLLRNEVRSSKRELYLALVCSNNTICLLSKSEIGQLVDLMVGEDKWISVNSGHGKSLWVAGSKGELPYSIRHNDFPRKLFSE